MRCLLFNCEVESYLLRAAPVAPGAHIQVLATILLHEWHRLLLLRRMRRIVSVIAWPSGVIATFMPTHRKHSGT
jgi:hypothetical protein